MSGLVRRRVGGAAWDPRGGPLLAARDGANHDAAIGVDEGVFDRVEGRHSSGSGGVASAARR